MVGLFPYINNNYVLWGGGGGGGGAVTFQTNPSAHNGGDAGGWGNGNQTGSGFGGSGGFQSGNLLISQMAALNNILKIEIYLTLNDVEQPVIIADETTTTDVLPDIRADDIVSGYAKIYLPDNDVRTAQLDETEVQLSETLKFKVPYKYLVLDASGSTIGDGTYFARNGIDLATYADASQIGWKCEQDGSVHYGNIVNGVRGDISLRPEYAGGGLFSVTYVSAAQPVSGDSYDITSTLTLPTPTKSGLLFEGWYEDSSFTEPSVSSIPPGLPGNKTYYAKWTATVTFSNNGGSGTNADQTIVYGDTVDTSLVSNPTKSGCNFGDWRTSTDGGATLAATAYNFSSPVTTSFTLYANWQAITHTVTYHSDYPVTIADSYKTFTEEAGLSSLPSVSTGTGISFEGWYASSDFSGSEVTDIPANTTVNQDLYAKVVVYVVINAGGGYSLAQQPVLYGKKITSSDLDSAKPPRFKHWSNVSSTSTTAYDFNTTVTSQFTLYAVKESTITYCYTTATDLIPTTKIADTYRSYIEGVGLTLPTSLSWPVATTASFEGWYTSPARTDATKVTSISTTQTGNVTLYAKFSVTTSIVSISIDKATLTALAAGNSCITFEPNTSATDYRFIPANDITQSDLSTLVSTLKALDVWFGIGGSGGYNSYPAGIFDGCTKLVSMTLPGTSGFRISTAAFTNCPNFTTVSPQSTGWKMDMTTSPAPDNDHACTCPAISTINGVTYGSNYVWVKD